MYSRRDILRKTGLASLLASIPIDSVRRLSLALAATDDSAVGELYAGFLLLPEGTPSPPQVVYPMPGPPIVCGVAGEKTTAISQVFNTHDQLRRASGIPLYSINALPSYIQPDGGYIIEQEWGSVFFVLLGYNVHNANTGAWEAGLSLSAQPTFPQPFPFWYGPSPTSVDGIARGIWPQKVGMLPSPGLR